jgi:S-adenosylmethionine/arginine decarboxylase-like enzyme
MIEHKHLIIRGKMEKSLLKADVWNLLNDLVSVLDMELMEGVATNPNVGYEGGENGGVTGCALITTSHIVLHTWDKAKYFQFDAYSCKNFEPKEVITELHKWGLIAEDNKYFDRAYNLLDITHIL